MDKVKGEFVVLKCLSSFDGVVCYSDLKDRVRKVVREIDDPPFCFVPKGDSSYSSTGFVEAFSGCCAWDKVDEVDGGYVLGESVDVERYEEVHVSEEFVKDVNSVLVLVCV